MLLSRTTEPSWVADLMKKYCYTLNTFITIQARIQEFSSGGPNFQKIWKAKKKKKNKKRKERKRNETRVVVVLSLSQKLDFKGVVW